MRADENEDLGFRTTLRGRIVYERKRHYFTIRDVNRILRKLDLRVRKQAPELRKIEESEGLGPFLLLWEEVILLIVDYLVPRTFEPFMEKATRNFMLFIQSLPQMENYRDLLNAFGQMVEKNVRALLEMPEVFEDFINLIDREVRDASGKK